MQEFHEELLARTSEVEKLLKSLSSSSTSTTSTRSLPRSPRAASARQNDSRVVSPFSASVATSAGVLQRKWTTVSRMSTERSKRLSDMYNRLLEVPRPYLTAVSVPILLCRSCLSVRALFRYSITCQYIVLLQYSLLCTQLHTCIASEICLDCSNNFIFVGHMQVTWPTSD